VHLASSAIVLSVRTHGESGAIVRALTPEDGVRPGYVRGGHSRRLRPILQPANTVLGEWRARTDEQLAALTVELAHSRAPLHAEPAAAAALAWVTALAAVALPEAQPYPRLHAGLEGMLDAIKAAPSAQGWAPSVARFELLMLAELGFGLDLDRCTVTGVTEDLAYVSPKSGAAVSRAGAAGYEAKLLPLPAFLREGGAASWPDIFAALAITGRFVERDLLSGRAAEALPARERLLDRLKRAVA
jgi:DNA repair protein RecO (recombination protein O)